jgi:hypothetical protein
MTPDERLERIERDMDEMRELLKESLKRHQDFKESHESWLVDLQSVVRELAASQLATEERLQRLIRALGAPGRRGNGHA